MQYVVLPSPFLYIIKKSDIIDTPIYVLYTTTSECVFTTNLVGTMLIL